MPLVGIRSCLNKGSLGLLLLRQVEVRQGLHGCGVLVCGGNMGEHGCCGMRGRGERGKGNIGIQFKQCLPWMYRQLGVYQRPRQQAYWKWACVKNELTVTGAVPVSVAGVM
jgi:hypothetical protein